jgi:hypothetical protein
MNWCERSLDDGIQMNSNHPGFAILRTEAMKKYLLTTLKDHGSPVSAANQRRIRAREMPTCKFGCLNDRSDQTSEASEVNPRNRTRKTSDENVESIRLEEYKEKRSWGGAICAH